MSRTTECVLVYRDGQAGLRLLPGTPGMALVFPAEIQPQWRVDDADPQGPRHEMRGLRLVGRMFNGRPVFVEKPYTKLDIAYFRHKHYGPFQLQHSGVTASYHTSAYEWLRDYVTHNQRGCTILDFEERPVPRPPEKVVADRLLDEEPEIEARMLVAVKE